jgi:hypothetical protein
MYNLILPLPIPSKKNSKRIIINRGRPRILSSKEYIDWENSMFYYLLKEKITNLHLESVHIELRFYPKDKKQFDMSNKVESIFDLLVRYKTLVDDNFKIIKSYNVVFVDYDKINPRVEVDIYKIS